jgi:DNA-cytosine methyltransferase
VTHDLTHASFFSGVGGLDLGLERAGWRTVSFSEIDPYASAVLAERWPGVPNLGSITDLARGRESVGSGEQHGQHADGDRVPAVVQRLGDADDGRDDRRPGGATGERDGGIDWADATLWTGGFPCQDLSVAGKRRGMGTHADRLDTRSGLAYAFLDLVERHRPPAIVLENVPGLLSSNGGRDLGALLGRLGELGYWWAYRVLDARHFGVPQRRRRVFIVAIHARVDPAGDGPAEVLSVGSRCDRHPTAGSEARAGAAGGADGGADIVGTIPAGLGHHGNGGHSSQAVASGHVIPIANGLRASDGHHGHGSPRGDGGDNLVVGTVADERASHNGRPGADADQRVQPEPGRDAGTTSDGRLVGASPDPRGVRAADGLAGRLDDRAELDIAATLNSGGNDGDFRTEPGEHLTIVPFVKRGRAQTADDGETWGEGDVMPTLNGFDVGDVRTTAAILGTDTGADPLLPDGLDSHRYRTCGNGVVSHVAEWLGWRLREYFEHPDVRDPGVSA